MSHTFFQANVSVRRDNTGLTIEFPTLFADRRPIERLLEYQIENIEYSKSWHRKLLEALRAFFEYAACNPDECRRSQVLIQNFSVCLQRGTIKQGEDPSGLYWLPRAREKRNIVRRLTELSKWLHDHYGAPQLNPLRAATGHEQALAYLAWMRKKNVAFLSHVQSETNARAHAALTSSISHTARLPKIFSVTKAFPPGKVFELIFHGFLKHRSLANPLLRINLRDALITLLLHGGGLRKSDAFQAWICDVHYEEHPAYPGEGVAWVRIGHPQFGKVKFTNPLTHVVSECTKAEYLIEHGMCDRDSMIGSKYAGWKNSALDDRWYLEVHWAPRRFGQWFFILWQLYLRQILPLKRNHPYAWVTMNHDSPGAIYSIEHYDRSHERAVERIGLQTAKELGTTPHGHRHSYGHFLDEIGMSPRVIQKCMHHGSPLSQLVYTDRDRREMGRELDEAQNRMIRGERPTEAVLFEKWTADIEQIRSMLNKGVYY